MWYALTNDNGETTSFGFGPGNWYFNGEVNSADDDTYLSHVSSRTFPITQKQYDAMMAFGQDPEAFDFSLVYGVLSNSCIDFTWRALEVGGLNPSGFQGDIKPTSNIDEVDKIAALEPVAARVTDLHTCPVAATPGLPIAAPGSLTVLIDGLPAAREYDLCTCTDGVDMINDGEQSVLIEGQPAARVGDPTEKGGMIVGGSLTLLIGLPRDPFERDFLFMTGMKLGDSLERFESLTGESLSKATVRKLFDDPDFAEKFLTENKLVHSVYRDILNTNIPKTEKEAIAEGYIRQPDLFAKYHDPDNNYKYLSPDGHREAVYNKETGNLETDRRYKGTFNFYDSFFDHKKADMNPYSHWKKQGVY